MPGAGYAATIKAGGPSTAATQMATTKLVANTVYQITDASRRILDPKVAIVVEVDADGGGAGGFATAAADTYTVDYLFGKITFNVDQGVDAIVVVTGNYISPVTISEAKSASVDLEAQIEDVTSYPACSDGYKRKQATVKSAKASLSGLKVLQHDHDDGAGTTSFTASFGSRTPLFVEIRPEASGDYFRGWFLLESLGDSFTPEGMYEGTVEGASAPVAGLSQTESATFGWGQ